MEETLKLKYEKLQAMYEHLQDSHNKLQNEVTHYRSFHEDIRCKFEGVSERLEEVITIFEDLTSKNFHALQNSVNEMAEKSSLAMAELSVGIQTDLSRVAVCRVNRGKVKLDALLPEGHTWAWQCKDVPLICQRLHVDLLNTGYPVG